jgi:hypothetical protein
MFRYGAEDVDVDGKAEVVVKTAPGRVFTFFLFAINVRLSQPKVILCSSSRLQMP